MCGEIARRKLSKEFVERSRSVCRLRDVSGFPHNKSLTDSFSLFSIIQNPKLFLNCYSEEFAKRGRVKLTIFFILQGAKSLILTGAKT